MDHEQEEIGDMHLLNAMDDSALSDNSFCSEGDEHQGAIVAHNESGIFYEDDLILSREDLIEELELPTQEEFEIIVKRDVLTSTDPDENLADRLNKIWTTSRSLSKSF